MLSLRKSVTYGLILVLASTGGAFAAGDSGTGGGNPAAERLGQQATPTSTDRSDASSDPDDRKASAAITALSPEGGGGGVVNGHVLAIDSADSCQLHQSGKQVSATGDCPAPKSCTLQERRKNSIQPWKATVANPQPPESQMEYRPDCI